MKQTTTKPAILRMAWSFVLGGALALCASSTALAQEGQPAPGGPPPGQAQGSAKMKMANLRLVTPAKKVDGSYDVTLVLPAWTVQNILTLCTDGNTVSGSLHNTADSKLMGNVINGVANDSGFLLNIKVGPGSLDFVGFADGKNISGKVTIDKLTSGFKGTVSDKKFDCPAK